MIFYWATGLYSDSQSYNMIWKSYFFNTQGKTKLSKDQISDLMSQLNNRSEALRRGFGPFKHCMFITFSFQHIMIFTGKKMPYNA